MQHSFCVYLCTLQDFFYILLLLTTDLIHERCSNFLSHCASFGLVIGTLALPHFWNTMSTANRLLFLSSHLLKQIKTFLGNQDSLDLIQSPSTSVKIQIIGGKV